MKLYRGKKRLCMRHIPSMDREILRWALSVKPGDYIGTCFGYNSKVTEIVPMWRNEGKYYRNKKNKNWFLEEVRFTDTKGRWHFCPGGGCAFPPETPKFITEYFLNYYKDFLNNPSDWEDPVRAQKIVSAIEGGIPIVNEFGELLPEFLL